MVGSQHFSEPCLDVRESEAVAGDRVSHAAMRNMMATGLNFRAVMLGAQEVRDPPIHRPKLRCTAATFLLGPHSVSGCTAIACWKFESMSSKLTVLRKPQSRRTSNLPRMLDPHEHFRMQSNQACTVTGQAAGMTVHPISKNRS